MKKIFLILMLSLCFLSCKKNKEEQPETATAVAFDKEKWKIKENEDYPNRKDMVEDLVSGDTLKKLDKVGILELLGDPTRTDLNYLFYQIDQKRIASWPLSTKTLVIKFKVNDTVEWVKIHG